MSLQEATMSSALSLIVLGQVYFLDPAYNISLNTSNSILNLTIPQKQCQPDPVPGVRRNDYTYTPGIGGHKVHTQATTWNMARKICREEGGHLAIINSNAESDVIGRLFRESGPHRGSDWHNFAAIGFHDLYQEGEFITIHGESLETTGFNEWFSGEPNDQTSYENCGSVSKSGQLNDIPCGSSHGFICELPYVEENLIAPR